jgi:hypothetical protein
MTNRKADRSARGSRGGKRGRGGARPQAPRRHADQTTPSIKAVTDKLTVSNLAYSVTEADVKEVFSRIGIDR